MASNLITRSVACYIFSAITAVAISSTANGPSPLTATGQTRTIDPKFVNLVRQGESALKSKQYDVAISRFNAALGKKPEKNIASVIYAKRAYAYIGKQQLQKSMDDANESIRLNPRFFGGYLQRGIVYRLTGNLENAISDYNVAIRLNPTDPLADYDRALAYGYKGDRERRYATIPRHSNVIPRIPTPVIIAPSIII